MSTGKHRELCELGGKWLFKINNWKVSCPFVCVELVCQGGIENPDILGLRNTGTIMIEVKVSRSDFLRDKKKPTRQGDHPFAIGTQRYYMAPKGLIKKEELPERWGLIEHHGGKKFTIVQDSDSFEESSEAVYGFYLSIMRREIGYKIFDFRNK